MQRLREKYEQSLQEINKYNPVYIEDMTSVFIKCQEMEETRLRFFKTVLFSIHKSLNFSQDPSLPQIYEEFYHTINNADHQKDLKWWSNNHGVNMAMNWPAFVVIIIWIFCPLITLGSMFWELLFAYIFICLNLLSNILLFLFYFWSFVFCLGLCFILYAMQFELNCFVHD